MSNVLKIACIAAVGIVVCCVGGCDDGGAADAIRKRRSNLQQLGIAYQGYYQDNKRSAANAAELLGFMELQGEADPQVRDAITSLEEGDIVMAWGGRLEDPATSAKFVLGFEAGVPSTGGYVVMGDGTVRLMTAKDFSEASLLPAQAD